MLLYRVRSGDTCVLTTACLIGDVPYNAEATAESEIVALSLPKEHFFAFLDSSTSFRKTVFSLFARRLSEIVHLFERISFYGVDTRLADYLCAMEKGGVVNATQTEIATELGTAREVIGRHLKQFASNGLVQIEPSRISLLNIDGLRDIADRI